MKNKYLKLLTIIVFFNSLSTIIDYDFNNILYWIKLTISIISIAVCIFIYRKLQDDE